MADVVPAAVRSRMMAGIKGRDTKPEMVIRRALHAAGFRYRLHDRKLPGSPDLVFPARRAVLFVNGCFWHGHDCHLFRWPSTRRDFWETKITRNRERDAKADAQLAQTGWRIATVWECALKGKQRLEMPTVTDMLTAWLRSDNPRLDIRGLPA